MTRLLRARHRACRRFGAPICGSPKCPAVKRPYPPGEHGRRRGRRLSRYGRQLLEKQKMRFTYGLSERQLRNLHAWAARRPDSTGQAMLAALEARLDNVVYRMGMAPTRRAARQLVVHRHIEVNGQAVNVPSYRLKPGDRVRVRSGSPRRSAIQAALEQRPEGPAAPNVTVDAPMVQGTFERLPDRSEVPEAIDEQMVVEYYSR